MDTAPLRDFRPGGGGGYGVEPAGDNDFVLRGASALQRKKVSAYMNGRLSCGDANGKFTALEYDHGIDHGAYSEAGDNLMGKFRRFMGFGYNVPVVSGLHGWLIPIITLAWPIEVAGCPSSIRVRRLLWICLRQRLEWIL